MQTKNEEEWHFSVGVSGVFMLPGFLGLPESILRGEIDRNN
jgi:hypothetical protein